MNQAEYIRVKTGFAKLLDELHALNAVVRPKPTPVPTLDELRTHYAAYGLAFRPKRHEAKTEDAA